jgi:hypothetical protein
MTDGTKTMKELGEFEYMWICPPCRENLSGKRGLFSMILLAANGLNGTTYMAKLTGNEGDGFTFST